jgi:hypothetical protein
MKTGQKQGGLMRIDAVGLNRPLNRAQGSIKKIAGIRKPLTMAVPELPEDAPAVEPQPTVARAEKKPSNRLDTLGSEVDVWV